MADSASTRESVTPKDWIISVGSFDGFQWKNGRLSLGWVSFGSAPRDLESRLEKAVQEIDALKAELDRVSAEAEQMQSVVQENKELKAKLSRISSEIERLQALMERVSSGVR
jgi:prefoldin subunit 5